MFPPNLKLKKGIYIGLILVFLFTLPVFWNLFSSIPGRGADTYQAIGRAMMVQNSIKDVGIMKTFEWQKQANFWGIIPIIGYTEAILGRIPGYNFWWLLSFFLAFLGSWVLIQDITKSDWASFVGGFIFAFSPFHFSQALATNIGTMHYEWLVWLVFFLYQFYKKVSFKSALGVATSLVLVIATEHQMLAFILLFMIAFIPFLSFCYPKSLKRGRFWMAVVIGLIVVVVTGIIQFKNLWKIAQSDNNFLKPPYSQVEDYSADAVDFLLPARFQPFWGEKFNAERGSLSSNIEGRQSFYLGYVAIILFFLGAFQAFKRRSKFGKKEKKFAIFFFTIAIVFIILSFGPTLHFKGNIYLEKKLPYFWIYNNIPYWNFIRTTSRIFLIALLGFSFLAGLGAKVLEDFYKRIPLAKRNNLNKLKEAVRQTFSKKKSLNRSERLRIREQQEEMIVNAQEKTIDSKYIPFLKLAFLAIFVLLPLEYLAVPVQALDLAYSPFYDQIAKDKEPYAILEVPGSTSYNFASYCGYTAQIHQKPKIDGMDFAREQKDFWTFQRNTPIINTLLYSLPNGGTYSPEEKSSDIITTDYTPLAKSIFNFYNIRYLTLSKFQTGEKFDQEAFDSEKNYIENVLGISSSYEDNFLRAYKVPQEVKTGHFLTLDTNGDYWNGKEGGGKTRARWAKSGAKLNLVNLSETPRNIELTFKGKIAYLRTLEILLNGQLVKAIPLSEFNSSYSILFNQVPPGNNTIEFVIKDQDGKIINDYNLSRGVKFSQLQTTEK